MTTSPQQPTPVTQDPRGGSGYTADVPTSPRIVPVVVEVPRGSLVKYTAAGAIDYISPLPCPFNYGHVPGHPGHDGDPLDAVVIGPRLARGTRVEVPVRAVIHIRDAGLIDDKLICKVTPLSRTDTFAVWVFFRSYGWTKGALNLVRGRWGRTAYEGWEERER